MYRTRVLYVQVSGCSTWLHVPALYDILEEELANEGILAPVTLPLYTTVPCSSAILLTVYSPIYTFFRIPVPDSR